MSQTLTDLSSPQDTTDEIDDDDGGRINLTDLIQLVCPLNDPRNDDEGPAAAAVALAVSFLSAEFQEMSQSFTNLSSPPETSSSPHLPPPPYEP